MSKIISVVGTRPNFLKIDPDLKQFIMNTGQHYDKNMSSDFFEELSLPKPIFNLESTHVGDMIDKIMKYLDWNEPDLVIVYGDTNSSFAGAYSASQLGIPVAHVEAGLRSYNKQMTEENNRVLIDHLATFRFVPTINALQNLESEGIYNNNFLVGDVLYDRILMSTHPKSSKKDFILLTLHRKELVDYPENIQPVMDGLLESKEKFIWPMHPRTKTNLNYFNIEIPSNVEVIEPQSYLSMVKLENEAKKIVTDSGGVQKEAYFLATPCITVRNETEWIETLQDGWNILVGYDKDKLIKAIKEFTPKGIPNQSFGDGHAFEKIRKILLEHGY